MTPRPIVLMAVGLALGVLTGCGSGSLGWSVTRSAAPAAPSTPTLPPRPRAIPVVGLDACSIVPVEVLAPLGLPTTGVLDAPDPSTPRISTCEWKTDFGDTGSPVLDLTVDTADQDTARFLTFPTAKQTSVGGFGAVDGVQGLVTLSDDRSCLLRIDVAPGQGLWVEYDNPLGDLPGTSHELMCQRATTVAEAIINRLSAKQN